MHGTKQKWEADGHLMIERDFRRLVADPGQIAAEQIPGRLRSSEEDTR